jgi:hypothetical protein
MSPPHTLHAVHAVYNSDERERCNQSETYNHRAPTDVLSIQENISSHTVVIPLKSISIVSMIVSLDNEVNMSRHLNHLLSKAELVIV